MLLGDPRQSDQRTQSFHFPIVVHQSLDPAAQSSAQAPSSLSFNTWHALRSSSARQAQTVRVRTRRRVGSTRRRGNHMHDHSRFQRDINDVTGVSLSLSLSLSQKSLTHNIGSASALPIITDTDMLADWKRCHVESSLRAWASVLVRASIPTNLMNGQNVNNNWRSMQEAGHTSRKLAWVVGYSGESLNRI